MKSKVVMCRHCGTKPATRPRGLCWTDYYKIQGVREKYPADWHPCGRRGVKDFEGPAPEPTSATDAAPGSEAKIVVLAERAAAGQALHHADDRRIDHGTPFGIRQFGASGCRLVHVPAWLAVYTDGLSDWGEADNRGGGRKRA